MDRKTGKLYPSERKADYRGDTYYTFNDKELRQEFAYKIQKELMKNKLFRSKVGDVTVK